jgi:phosphoribosyl-ATP pyrophosphohydrolase/phosphoribosyl-AMP cyclohydrolase
MLRFDTNGLIPVIVQHARSGEVLMLGYMNEEALHRTQESGTVTFWSRSRNELWTKGATSGNWLRLVELRQDCDGDVLLVRAEPDGPTCHTGNSSCFYRDLHENAMENRVPYSIILTLLEDIIRDRNTEQAAESYTVKLLRGGVDRIGKKIGEEATEVVIAAKNGSRDELVYEVADLFYHTLVLLENQRIPLEAIWAELLRRTTEPKQVAPPQPPQA